MKLSERITGFVLVAGLFFLGGCSLQPTKALVGPPQGRATLMPRTITYQDLVALPKPKGKVVAAIYNFRDQTGQYRPSPASNFSTAVTQGGTAMLTVALQNSDWFIPLEREGLQNLLTERKIIRAAQKKPNTPANNNRELSSLLAANVLLEGGIIGFETNTRTGGIGARYFGLGGSEQYRVDQVTVNLRAIDIRTGQVLNAVTTTKTILSRELQAGIYRFLDYKRLLEAEMGFTTNEPVQVCVMSAIEAAVIHLIAEGIRDETWRLANSTDIDSPVLQAYLQASVPMI